MPRYRKHKSGRGKGKTYQIMDDKNIYIKDDEWGHMTKGRDEGIGLDPKHGKSLQGEKKKKKKRGFESGFGF